MPKPLPATSPHCPVLAPGGPWAPSPRAATPANIFNICPFPLHLFLILGLERNCSPQRLAFLSEMPHTSTSPSPTHSFSACLPSQNVAEAEGFSWETELRQNLVSNRKSFHWRLLNAFPSAAPGGVWLWVHLQSGVPGAVRGLGSSRWGECIAPKL